MSTLMFDRDGKHVTKRQLVEVINQLCEYIGLDFDKHQVRADLNERPYSFSVMGRVEQIEQAMRDDAKRKAMVTQNTAAPAPQVSRVEFDLLLEQLGLEVLHYNGTFLDTKEKIASIKDGSVEIKSPARKK